MMSMPVGVVVGLCGDRQRNQGNKDQKTVRCLHVVMYKIHAWMFAGGCRALIEALEIFKLADMI